MIATIGLAAALFVATDIDDLVMLTALFALAPHRRRQIVCGQYLGIAALVAFSAAATLGLLALPGRWIRWIGLVPLVLGIKALVEVLRRSPDDEPDRPTMVGVIGTATLTIAGSKGMTVGTESDLGNSVAVYDSVSGAAGSMIVSNPGANILVRQFTAGSSGTQRSTLDLSGLGNFTAIGNSLEVGAASAVTTTRTAGTLYLAQSNTSR